METKIYRNISTGEIISATQYKIDDVIDLPGVHVADANMQGFCPLCRRSLFKHLTVCPEFGGSSLFVCPGNYITLSMAPGTLHASFDVFTAGSFEKSYELLTEDTLYD